MTYKFYFILTPFNSSRSKRKHNSMNSNNRRKTVNELIRFVLVGLVSTLIYFIASNLFYFVFNSGWLATGAAWVIGTIWSYTGHMVFTYRVKANHKRMSWRFLVLSVAMLAHAQVLTYLLYDLLSIKYFYVTIACVITSPMISYPLGKYFVFAGGYGEKRNSAKQRTTVV